jgi:hypothetical protein
MIRFQELENVARDGRLVEMKQSFYEH